MVLCTKLVQWLCVGGLVLGVWFILLSGFLPFQLSRQLEEVTRPVSLPSPHHMRLLCLIKAAYFPAAVPSIHCRLLWGEILMVS